MDPEISGLVEEFTSKGLDPEEFAAEVDRVVKKRVALSKSSPSESPDQGRERADKAVRKLTAL